MEVRIISSTCRACKQARVSMSVRPVVTGTYVGRRSRRLDDVLRAGQARANQDEQKPEPTGVLGPLLSSVPARPRAIFPPSRPPVHPNMPPMPDREPKNRQNRAYKSAIDRKVVRDKLVKTATVLGVKREGVYTGELVNGKPDGSGELVLPSSFSEVADNKYTLSEERVEQLKQEGASDEELRVARAEVERLAVIPRERYNEAWKSIKAFAREKDRKINLNTLVLWARAHHDQWDLFGAHSAMSLNELRDKYLARVMADGDLIAMDGGSLKTDGVLTTDEFNKYIDAFQRGEIDIVARRQALGTQKLETRRWATGIWYDGQLTDGMVSQEVQPTGSKNLVNHVDFKIKDARPLGGTEHTMSLLGETHEDGKLVHKVFVEDFGRQGDVWKLRGKILWTSRPTKLLFPWAGPTEMVKLRNGKGTLKKTHPSYVARSNPTLTGYAEVRLTIADTGEHLWLSGEMVNNKLFGEVTASGRVPGLELYDEHPRFFIDGYHKDGRPMVRFLNVADETPPDAPASPEPQPPKPSPPPPPPPPPTMDDDPDLNTEGVDDNDENYWMLEALTALGTFMAFIWVNYTLFWDLPRKVPFTTLLP